MSRSSRALVAVLVAAAATTAAAQKAEDLRLGVVGFYNPRLMVLKYQPLVDYLTECTGRAWELDIGTTYEETVDALCSDRLTAAYLGPFTYVRAHERCGAVPIARLETDGDDTYRSLILVRDDAPYDSLQSLRGHRFGFGAALSTSSHLMPRAMLEDVGVPIDDIDCLFYGHHERAARAVLLGEVDACGVRDIIGERFLDRGLRLLAVSDPIPNFPLVVSPRSMALADQILACLVPSDPAAAERMARWDRELASGFLPVDDAAYRPVAELAFEILGSEALRMSAEQIRADAGCR